MVDSGLRFLEHGRIMFGDAGILSGQVFVAWAGSPRLLAERNITLCYLFASE